MTKYFIPYSGKKPVSVSINGHDLILLSKDKDALENSLDDVGADRVKVVKVEDTVQGEEKFLSDFALKNSAGVVVMPSEISPLDLIKNLELQLPWIH